MKPVSHDPYGRFGHGPPRRVLGEGASRISSRQPVRGGRVFSRLFQTNPKRKRGVQKQALAYASGWY